MVVFSTSGAPPLFMVAYSFVVSILSFICGGGGVGVRAFPSCIRKFRQVLLRGSVGPFLVTSLWRPGSKWGL